MIESRTYERLASIDEKSWGLIYKELVRYADFKLNKAGFQIRTEKDSVDAEHFAALAIERLFDGTRSWDVERFPDVTIHLTGIVKSLISSHFKSSSRSIVKAGGKADEFVDNATDQNDSDELLSDDSLVTESPEELLIEVENWVAIEEAFGQNKDDHAIFCEWLDGTPPRKIAEGYEIRPLEVYNAIKRGTRIVRTLFNKQL